MEVSIGGAVLADGGTSSRQARFVLERRQGSEVLAVEQCQRSQYFGWRHVIGQVLFNLEPNRRLVSANASD